MTLVGREKKKTLDAVSPIPCSSLSDQAHQIDKTLLQEKLFASSVGTHDIQPYFYKATNVPAQDQITITTTITKSRIPTLARLANRFKGKNEQNLFEKKGIRAQLSIFYHDRTHFGRIAHQS